MSIESTLTIIIPAYNEEKGISDTLKELLPVAVERNWHIIVINDGSVDATADIVNGFSSVRLLSHPYNRGYGAALKTGIRSAETEFVALYDADGQHTPVDLVRLFEGKGSYDMVIGKRGKDSHHDWIRKPGKWVLSRVANTLTGIKIPDLNSGLRVIRTSAIINLLHLFPDGFSFSTTSTIAFMNLGLFVGYIPIVVRKRVGTSTVKQFKHGSNTIMLILRLIVLFNPLKIFLPMSIGIFSLGSIYELIYGVILIPGVKVLPAAILMMLSGILVFFFGLLVDQVSEMRKHLYLK